MILSNIIQRATDFGTFRSQDNFASFTLKILFYIIPAVILGNYTDRIIETLQKNKSLGENTLYYIMLQTLLILVSLYLILVFLSDFMSEIQVTIAGSYFIVLYFGIQTNYIHMIQEYMKQAPDQTSVGYV